MKKINYESQEQGNPFLPLWEHIPDGEPYVFDDPDNPGKRRVYIYGSHDTHRDSYCGDDLVVWSAPVEDLSDWRCDGVIFESIVDGKPDTLFAPDVALVTTKNGGKKYYLYPNNQSWGRGGMAAVSSRPDGGFKVCNLRAGNESETDGCLGFDPAVLADDDGCAYGYWGFRHSEWARLDPDTMATLMAGETAHSNIPSWDEQEADGYDPSEYNIVIDENVRKWGFFEASSIRKVGNKYVFIYSRNGRPEEPTGKNYNQLAYGYSDSPCGPWKWGGIIVDAQGEAVKSPSGGYDRSFQGGNTHGSICEIDGRWYVFYHRNVKPFARQAMAEPIEVEWDWEPVSLGGGVRISTAEVTTSGFYADGMNPYKKVKAARACYLRFGGRLEPVYDKNADAAPIFDLPNGAVVGFKYFNFDIEPRSRGIKLMLELAPKCADCGVDVYMRPPEAAGTPVVRGADGEIMSVGDGSKKLCSVKFDGMAGGGAPEIIKIDVPEIAQYRGRWGVFFVFHGSSAAPVCDFYSMMFSS